MSRRSAVRSSITRRSGSPNRRRSDVVLRREFAFRRKWRAMKALLSVVLLGISTFSAAQPVSIDPPRVDGPAVEWRHLGYGMEPDPGSPYVSWRTHHDPLHGAKVKGAYFQHRAAAEPSVHVEPVMRIIVAAGLEAQVPVSLPMSATK